MSVEQARKAALKTKSDIAQGVSPNLEKKKFREETTFGELFQRYLNEYSKVHKKSWQYDEREVKKFLSQWFPSHPRPYEGREGASDSRHDASRRIGIRGYQTPICP